MAYGPSPDSGNLTGEVTSEDEKLLDEIAYEVRCWDLDRRVPIAELSARLLKLVREWEARGIAAD